jgi:hypothetical protein
MFGIRRSVFDVFFLSSCPSLGVERFPSVS